MCLFIVCWQGLCRLLMCVFIVCWQGLCRLLRSSSLQNHEGHSLEESSIPGELLTCLSVPHRLSQLLWPVCSSGPVAIVKSVALGIGKSRPASILKSVALGIGKSGPVSVLKSVTLGIGKSGPVSVLKSL